MGEKQLATNDMYGNEIHRLGDSGYGISVSVDADGRPYFTVFHEGPRSQQSLCTLEITGQRPTVCDVFDDRIAEIFGPI